MRGGRDKLFGIVIALLLTGCEPRGQLSFVQSPPAASRHEILVASPRSREPAGLFYGTGRGQGLGFGAFTVSVPTSHLPGSVSWPNGTPDPEEDFVVTRAEIAGSEAGFDRMLRDRLRAAPASEAVIFVHGYNTNHAEALYRFTQVVHDFGAEAVPVLYSWPSAARATDYLYDRDSVLFARDGLEQLIDRVQAAGAGQVLLVAHSLGSQLMVEALRQKALRGHGLWPSLSGVVLISPDIDIDVFRAQAATIGALPQPFIIISSRADRALLLSRLISQSETRLGEVENLRTLSALDVTVIDTTGAAVPGSGNHLTAVTSPALITLLSGLEQNRSLALETPVPPGLPVRLVSEGQAVGLVIGGP